MKLVYDRATTKVKLFVPSGKMPMDEILQKAEQDGVTLAPNRALNDYLLRSRGVLQGKHDGRLGDGEFKGEFASPIPCITGTLFVCAEKGKPLPKQVEFIDTITGLTWVFEVPEQHIGKDGVIASEHGDYAVRRDGKTRIVVPSECGLLADIRNVRTRYSLEDSVYGIGVEATTTAPPIGRYLTTDERAILQMKTSDKSVVTLIGRDNFSDIGTYDNAPTCIFAHGYFEFVKPAALIVVPK